MAHGKHYYLGVSEDEVEAAKAWELHGEFAYLNFPEDFPRRGRRQAGAARATRSTGRRSRRL